MGKTPQKQLFVYDWQGPDAPSSFAAIADIPYSIFFDSAMEQHPLSRYSYLCWNPFDIIDTPEQLKDRLDFYQGDFQTHDDLPPFQGGAAGYFGYDLGRRLEKIPAIAQTTNQPDIGIGLYDKILAFDHHTGKAHLIIHADDKDAAQEQYEWILSRVQNHIPQTKTFNDLLWESAKGDEEYKADIARVIEYIHAGDIFQANLSRRISADIPESFDSYTHYTHMRMVNPAPFGAFMNFGDVKLSSCSPERFIEVKGRHIETRPIKGTMPSSFPASHLAQSEKDRAENIMIVDLLRNDLSKVCEDHSVIVKDLCGIESFAGLHHMISTITGTLRDGKTALDALTACFPGGSITGAPKIRAMEIIEELEPHRRGAYCGAMGWIGFNGDMDTAITIRTLVYEGDQVHLQTGGGITALSDAQGELDETKLKAGKILESFKAATPKGKIYA